jgi:hypothetical protein
MMRTTRLGRNGRCHIGVGQLQEGGMLSEKEVDETEGGVAAEGKARGGGV